MHLTPTTLTDIGAEPIPNRQVVEREHQTSTDCRLPMVD
jgi:hypothetical protein